MVAKVETAPAAQPAHGQLTPEQLAAAERVRLARDPAQLTEQTRRLAALAMNAKEGS